MSSWAEVEFSTVDLGDVRRSERLKKVVERMWQAPGASQRGAAEDWAGAMGSYRLWKPKAVTAEAILAAHQDQVRDRVRGNRILLHIQDTTELDYSQHKTIKGLGPLSDITRRGLFAHSEYLLQGDGVPLGLWHCHLWVRSDEEHGQSDRRKQQAIEEKESYRWLEASRRACELRALCPKQLVITASDRESDIYESFEEFWQRLRRGEPCAHFIIRCNQDRKITPQAQDLEQHTHIKAAVAAAPVLGTTTLEIRSKQQCKKVKGNRQLTLRTARTAELEIRACEVELVPPRRPQGQKLSPIKVWVVLAKELNPPVGEEAIEWILLTDFKVRTLKKALQILKLYTLRWQIEVFHKVLKSGCQVEAHPPEDVERLRPRLAVQMVIAWRIHYLTLLGRECPDLPADVLFEEWEWKPMAVVFSGKPAPLHSPSLAQMIAWIAKAGGHIGRKGDGPPGPRTIWKGMAKMFAYGELWKALHSPSQEVQRAKQESLDLQV
jgi:hypothetical protein